MEGDRINIVVISQCYFFRLGLFFMEGDIINIVVISATSLGQGSFFLWRKEGTGSMIYIL